MTLWPAIYIWKFGHLWSPKLEFCWEHQCASTCLSVFFFKILMWLHWILYKEVQTHILHCFPGMLSTTINFSAYQWMTKRLSPSSLQVYLYIHLSNESSKHISTFYIVLLQVLIFLTEGDCTLFIFGVLLFLLLLLRSRTVLCTW
jgi:hypothetical protein